MSSFANENVSESKQGIQQLEQEHKSNSNAKPPTITPTSSNTIDDNSVKKTNENTIESENKTATISKLTTTTTPTGHFNKNDEKNNAHQLKNEHEFINKSSNANQNENAAVQQSPILLSSAALLTSDSSMPTGDTELHTREQERKQLEPGTTTVTEHTAIAGGGISKLRHRQRTPPTTAAVSSPLPLGLSSNLVTHLPHISSEPTFGVQLREKQHQERLNEEKLEKESADSTVPYHSSAIKSGTVSATASPNMVRKSSDGSVSLPRRVSFPKSDNELVTGYLEPANPWEHVCMVKSISEIAELYMTSCHKHNTKPLQCILDHLKAVDLTKQLRQPLLSLKSIQLAPSDCEALEEVLKRVQYKSIDISDCKLNETAASALFEIIEYYEATNELDISSNATGMTHRGWLSCTYMISHSQELQVLNAEGNPITKISADHLGSALNTSNLHTLKLERCGLKGAPLSSLCFKLLHNKTLKELWIAYNDLDCNDADIIAEMLKVNHYLELIDISNNNIGDNGLRHIVQSLIMQSKELERRTTFQRAAAIDDDESMSPFETSAPVDLCDGKEMGDWNTADENHSAIKTECDVDVEAKFKHPLSKIDEKPRVIGCGEPSEAGVKLDVEPRSVVSTFKPPLISTVGSTIEEIDPDEDTDDTVRSSTLKGNSQTSGGGQSMLDKLLSMNSESSSEDGVSNISTDTLAACCSEDASLISDDVFDVAATVTAPKTMTTSDTFVKCPNDTDSEISEGTTEISSLISNPSAARVALEPSVSKADVDKRDLITPSTNNSSSALIEPAAIPICNVTLEAPTSIQTPLVNNYVSINNNNDVSNDNNNVNATSVPVQNTSSTIFSGSIVDKTAVATNVDIYEVKAEERNCQQSDADTGGRMLSGEAQTASDPTNSMQHHAASKALDVNKNTKLGEDFDDTHSTDSAFESASEGDISRHLPEEFTRLSASLESTRLDDLAKEFSIETATIASESNECLIAVAASVTPSSTPTPQKKPFSQISTPVSERERSVTEASKSQTCLSNSLPATETVLPPTIQVGFGVLGEAMESPIGPVHEFRDKIPKVTIAQDSISQKSKAVSIISTSPSQTPPPPSTSPGGVSSGLRRTESTCAFLTQSTRNRSQSTDSLCSDNSLDGSIGSGDLNFSSSAQLNEKLTKNDTLTRQQRQLESSGETSARSPGGLKALALWNNNLTKEAGSSISDLLAETVSLELLNIGKNCLTNEFVSTIKDSLTKNTTLTTLGLQSAELSDKGIETLTSIMTFGGNCTLQRIDIRGNKVEVDSLTKIAEVLKSNTSVTQIDIDDEPKRLSVGSEAHLDYARVLENVRSMCARNEKTQQQEKPSINTMSKRKGGYYLGSRKISLTCHSRPVVDTTSPVVVTCSGTANSKLDVKRKQGTRLRSPAPSPTTISPSSSPNRTSRFQVFRVSEVSPLTSPSTQKQVAGGLAGTKAMSSSSVFIQSVPSDVGPNDPSYPNLTSTSLPTSCSLPSMATISSSTQSIKRLSVSPRSRFLVHKVYEDPSVPLSSRTIPPITPPINPPPTPMSKSSKEAAAQQINEATPPAKADKGDNYLQLLQARSSAQSPSITCPESSPISSTSLRRREQQESNTTTDSCATPILNARELGRATQQSEQSTNTPKSLITNSTNAATAPTAGSQSAVIQQSPSNLSTLSTLSSSSSSSTSDSSSSSATSSSTSSSSSTSPASNVDSSDSSSSVQSTEHADTQDLTISGQCPIAVFGDNDITLTKNTVNEALVTAAVADARDSTNSATAADDVVASPAAPQQRNRKASWIANPTAVDKLLTLFHNPFQRSSSPESKGVTSTSAISTTEPTQFSQAPLEQCTLDQQQSATSKTLLPLRKQSPPSWSKLGTDMFIAANSNNADLANTVATTAAAVVTEQSRSFLDAASKQFRVFRQNLSFGNESVTTASTTTITSSTVNNPNSGEAEMMTGMLHSNSGAAAGVVGGITSSCCIAPSSSAVECNVDTLPTDVKQEIKENISPEHTINEETLRTIQKMAGNATPSTASVTTPAECNYDVEDFVTKDTQTGHEQK
uniref:Leucine Rich repeat protein n=1 Tax=Musca domestica TaxID=7370 RepID=A0A1I8NDN1_MUSDO